MTDLQNKILLSMSNQQCYESEGFLMDLDEGPVTTYLFLCGDTHETKTVLRPAVLELRNAGLIKLETAFDRDYEFRAGSGYVLTREGINYCQSEGLHDDLPLPTKEN